MGRPRKRQFIETARTEPLATQPQNLEQGAFPSTPLITEDLDSCTDAVAEPYFTNSQTIWGLPAEITRPHRTLKNENGRSVWHFGDQEILSGPNIDYGNIDFGPADPAFPSIEATPQLSAASNSSVTDSEHSTPPAGGGTCSCLASMYLSLASLQSMPTDIVSALKTVRSAAATAARNCPLPFSCFLIVLCYSL
jgi:hypothetical protein